MDNNIFIHTKYFKWIIYQVFLKIVIKAFILHVHV